MRRIWFMALFSGFLVSCPSTTPTLVPVERNINPSQFVMATSTWDVGFGCSGGTNTDQCTNSNHVYGSQVGQFVYSFDLPAGNYGASTISATLSGEAATASSANPRTDVVLIINGKKNSVQNVIGDDGIGELRTWSIAAADLKSGTNTLIFAVESTATNKQGLCIYFSGGEKPIKILAQPL